MRDLTSSTTILNSGVPQDCILSPFLYPQLLLPPHFQHMQLKSLCLVSSGSPCAVDTLSDDPTEEVVIELWTIKRTLLSTSSEKLTLVFGCSGCRSKRTWPGQLTPTTSGRTLTTRHWSEVLQGTAMEGKGRCFQWSGALKNTAHMFIFIVTHQSQ